MSNKNSAPARPMGGGMQGGMGGEKPKSFKTAVKHLLSFLKPFMLPIVIAMVFAAAGAIMTVFVPDLIGDITMFIQKGLGSSIDMDAILEIVIVLVILLGLGVIFSYTQTYIMATVSQRVTKKMRSDISRKINKLPLKYYDNTTYGDVLSRVTNDVDTIGNTLNQSVVSLIAAIALFVGAVIMMFVTNWIMALTAIGASLVGFVIMIIIMGKSQKHFISQQITLGLLNGHIEEIFSGHNVVKAYNGEEEALKTFSKHNNELYGSAWKSQFYSGLMMPLMHFIGNLGYVAVCVVGGVLVLSGNMEFAVIVSFMIYIRLFTQPLTQFAQAGTSFQSGAAASERVFEFLKEEELEDESGKTTQLTTVQGEVVFDHVKFGYNPDKIIINDFSAIIQPGQKVAIVGPTGAGKTTLVNLLMRFYELDGGHIKIDGIPIDTLTRENIHSLFGMVLQDTWLFEGSIRDNVVYSKHNIDNDVVVKACKAVGLDHFIRTLPNGYDAILNDKASLSQGQKQLLTIARAMVENAPMIILDEATSSVDTRTEVLIQKAMDSLSKGRTSFVIAHRLSTIKNADVILVMKDGDILEHGNHDELMSRKGFYSELYNSQFENAGI